MKKIFTFLALAGIITSANAQSSSNTQTKITKEYANHQILGNKFFDNWFISVGAGGVLNFDDHNKQGKLKDNLSPNFGINIGKWFSPNIGTRVGIKGAEMRGLTQNGAHSTGKLFEGGQGLTHSKYNYLHYHGDVLFNLSNILAGYREDRFYNIIPYAGLGYMVIKDEPKAKEMSANIGINNEFRLSNAFSLNLDVRGVAVHDRTDGELGGRKSEGILTALVGLTYKFNKRNWDKPEPSIERNIITYDDAKEKQLIAENNKLREELKNALNLNSLKGDKSTIYIGTPLLVTFPINEATVSNEARVNLGYFAETLKKGYPNAVIEISGYADQGTGTVDRNQELSQLRAQAIYNILVNEFNVDASQLKVKANGGVDNMYYNDPRLSRAVITVIK